MTKNTWVNWAGQQRCTPAVVAAPRDVEELAATVTDAAAAGRTVRVAGSGHSFTDAVLTDGTLVDLSGLNKVLDVDVDAGHVRVEAGISLHAASPLLHAHGLAFPNLGDIDTQSLAGATATATHGTGARLRNISAALHSVEVLRADGTLVELNEQTDPDGWKAARVSVGALGVVTAATLQLEPSFVLECVERPVPLNEVLADIDEFADGSDHFEFFAFPHSDTAMTKAIDRTEAPEQPRGTVSEWLNDILIANHVYDGLCRLGRRIPAAIPMIHRAATLAGSNNRQVDRSYRVFSTPRLVKFNEMEYAIPRAHAAEARPATSRCTSIRAWCGNRISAHARRCSTPTTAGRTGANATSRPPRHCARATPNGTASPRSDGISTPPGYSPTITCTGCSAHWTESSRRGHCSDNSIAG